MNIPWQINNRLRALATAFALVWLSAIPLSAEEPYVHWAKSPMGGGTGNGRAMAVTGDGGLLVVDSFNTGALLKLSPQGELVSSNSLVGAGIGQLATDALGNQYWMGSVWAKGTFDFPSVQGFFLAKFGPNNNLLWVRNNEMPQDSAMVTTGGWCISVDSGGNIAVGGQTRGRLKLGSFESDGEESPFFCKYDTNGNLLWARKVESQYTGLSHGGACYDIALDGLGNVIACGILYEGISDFGGMTVYPGTSGYGFGGDAFIAKYGLNGELLWVQLGLGGSLAADKQGDIYVSWRRGVSGIIKLNGNGDLLWQKELPVYGGQGGTIALDEQGRPVFTGGFGGTVQFDAITLRSNGDSDFFVAKTDVDGNVLWAIAGGGGGTGEEKGLKVVCDSAGNVFLNAVIKGTAGSFDGITLVPRASDEYGTPMVARLSDRSPLEIARSAGGVQLSWPAKATNYVLEAAATSIAPGSAWSPVLTPPTTVGTQSTMPVDTTAPAQFFRLHKP